MNTGWVYILECSNKTYYIGSTNNLTRRFEEHSKGKSKYTRNVLPVKLVFKQMYTTLLIARKAESWIKKQKDRDLVERIILEGKINRDC